MRKISHILSAFLSVPLACLIGTAWAQDVAKPDAQPQAANSASGHDGLAGADQRMIYAPSLPGWLSRLPADKQEVARKIWLVEGRTILSLRETMQAKRHELNALQDMPNPDATAVAAVAREMGSTLSNLLMAEFAFHQKLEKEGIPTWGRGGMDGCAGMMHEPKGHHDKKHDKKDEKDEKKEKKDEKKGDKKHGKKDGPMPPEKAPEE